MKEKHFPGGAWPVMLTPFTESNEIDYGAVDKLVKWYIENKLSGIFAVCQSSEMFCLNLEERVSLAKATVEAAEGRIPVIASGHISDNMEDQIYELQEISKTGVDAVILITNRLAGKSESDEKWIENCEKIISEIDPEIPLGLYECPYPYKRLVTPQIMKWCLDSRRFYFIKDTCCDIQQLKEKIDIARGSRLKIYNANSTTLLASLKYGAAGYCGVMANFHPYLYAWMCDNFLAKKAEDLSDFMGITSLIERQYYPVNAKYYLDSHESIPMTTRCRTKTPDGLTETFKQEIDMLYRITQKERAVLNI